MKKLILAFLFTASALAHAQIQSTLEWSDPQDGVAIAVKVTKDSRNVPKLAFYLKNLGNQKIHWGNPPDARDCMIEFNGEFYGQMLAIEDFTTLYNEPGKQSDPIEIKLTDFFRLPDLNTNVHKRRIPEDQRLYLKLPKGAISLRIYYRFVPIYDENDKPQTVKLLFLKSKEIQFVNP